MDQAKSIVKHSVATKRGVATVAVVAIGAGLIMHYNKCKCVMMKNDKNEDVVSLPKLLLYSLLIGILASILIRVAKHSYKRMGMRHRRSPQRRRKYSCCM